MNNMIKIGINTQTPSGVKESSGKELKLALGENVTVRVEKGGKGEAVIKIKGYEIEAKGAKDFKNGEIILLKIKGMENGKLLVEELKSDKADNKTDGIKAEKAIVETAKLKENVMNEIIAQKGDFSNEKMEKIVSNFQKIESEIKKTVEKQIMLENNIETNEENSFKENSIQQAVKGEKIEFKENRMENLSTEDRSTGELKSEEKNMPIEKKEDSIKKDTDTGKNSITIKLSEENKEIIKEKLISIELKENKKEDIIKTKEEIFNNKSSKEVVKSIENSKEISKSEEKKILSEENKISEKESVKERILNSDIKSEETKNKKGLSENIKNNIYERNINIKETEIKNENAKIEIFEKSEENKNNYTEKDLKVKEDKKEIKEDIKETKVIQQKVSKDELKEENNIKKEDRKQELKIEDKIEKKEINKEEIQEKRESIDILKKENTVNRDLGLTNKESEKTKQESKMVLDKNTGKYETLEKYQIEEKNNKTIIKSEELKYSVEPKEEIVLKKEITLNKNIIKELNEKYKIESKYEAIQDNSVKKPEKEIAEFIVGNKSENAKNGIIKTLVKLENAETGLNPELFKKVFQFYDGENTKLSENNENIEEELKSYVQDLASGKDIKSENTTVVNVLNKMDDKNVTEFMINSDLFKKPAEIKINSEEGAETGKGKKKLDYITINLELENIGKMVISTVLADKNKANISFYVSKEKIKENIKNDEQELKERFSAKGISLENINIKDLKEEEENRGVNCKI